MMNTLLIAALLALPGAAMAQTAPAPAPSPAATPAPAPKFTLDTPIQDIVADAQGKAVIDKNLPGLIGLPQYEMFKGLSLKQLQPYSDGKLTDEILAKTAADLAAIK
ncbi:hypothetical protein [Sphingomonas sp. HITSZ_GF]|uniref:hypothetical protein n=1 Tax=Sphingomonas sp. HITSZ_GF TaxID=3037247 RepID=UPI00240CFFAF|nr:hypothetical protein [Sphingomonas sp. HITSZ_GF]